MRCAPRPRSSLPLLCALVASALFAGACSRSGEEKLVITGSSTMAPVVAELAGRYEREHPGLRIDVQSGGSSRGISDVRAGLADIGMVSRELAQSESDLHADPIARDGIGIIVHARNPIAALTKPQVVAIYRKELANWKELGGPDAPILVVHKAEGRATLAVFLEYFGLEGPEVRADVIAGENEQAIKTVAGSENAIGYVSIGTAAVDIEHGVPIRLLAANGVPATLENLRRGVYPLARPLLLVTLAPAAGRVRDFLAYLHSDAATDGFEAQHFVQVAE